MLKCCGAERDTRFCPDCGMLLRRHGLETLLCHLRVQERKYAERVKEAEEMESERGLQHASRNHAKWSAWVAAVEPLVGKGE